MSEIALWRAVIAQAFSDATLDIFTQSAAVAKRIAKNDAALSPEQLIERRAKRAEHRANEMRRLTTSREAARAWLLRGGKDFKQVCDYADLDPEWVRDRATDIAAAGWVMDPTQRFGMAA